jgi:hypothetical protein
LKLLSNNLCTQGLALHFPLGCVAENKYPVTVTVTVTHIGAYAYMQVCAQHFAQRKEKIKDFAC